MKNSKIKKFKLKKGLFDFVLILKHYLNIRMKYQTLQNVLAIVVKFYVLVIKFVMHLNPMVNI